MFALVDCNNFYVSCERVFQPSLKDKPVVVLSNNDGIIIARSDEAKEIGVPMGAVEFEWREFLIKHNVAVFSSNYPLYGDMSSRVMSILTRFTPDLEIYSIDEAFMGLKGFDKNKLEAHAREARSTVLQWTGLPISIGVGPTKTLAKVAARIAKKEAAREGVCVLDSEEMISEVLKKIEVGDIWGVGYRWGERLKDFGIKTAADLRMRDSRWIRSNFSVVLERTARELAGEGCIKLEDLSERKQIMVSRSFRERVTDFEQMRGLMAGYVARAAERLRGQGSLCRSIMVFLHTSPHSKDPYYGNTHTVNLSQYTADTSLLIKVVNKTLKQIFKEGYRYMKSGVMLMDLIPANRQQMTLFSEQEYDSRAQRKMQLMDFINAKYGPQTLRLATESRERWYMHQDHLSHAYTTRWDELLVVK